MIVFMLSVICYLLYDNPNMDVPFHLLAGMIMSKKLTGDYLPAVCLFGVLPDLLGGASFQYSKVRIVLAYPPRQYIKQWMRITRKGDYIRDFDRYSFRMTHSIFFLPFVSFAAFVFFRDIWWILTLSYIFHLIIDLVTHGGKRAHQPFYPVSRRRVEGRFYEHYPYVFAAFWAGLIFAFSFL